MSGSDWDTALGLGVGAVFVSLLCYASIRWRTQLAAMTVDYRLSLRGILPRRVRESVTRFITAPAIIRGQMILTMVATAVIALWLWVRFILEVVVAPRH